MSDKKLEVEPFYLRQGKDIVNVMFAKHYLDNDLLRDSMGDMDEYIGYVIQCSVETAIRADRLCRRIRK